MSELASESMSQGDRERRDRACEGATESTNRPRVWLVSTIAATPDPKDLPTVRDTRMRTWCPDAAGQYHSTDGWHHSTWSELHERYDLVEVA